MEDTPWYRQFWPWFIMALPASVVVAGLATWWIAARNADSLVADDYYREGLAINRQLEKQARARALGIRAALRTESGAIELQLEGTALPPALLLRLVHPLDAEYDRQIALAQIRPGTYRADLSLAPGSRWIWQLEPLGQSTGGEFWRVDGELVIPDVDAR